MPAKSGSRGSCWSLPLKVVGALFLVAIIAAFLRNAGDGGTATRKEPTRTAVHIVKAQPSLTPGPSLTPSITLTPMPTRTPTATPIPAPTNTARPSDTPQPTLTPAPTNTPPPTPMPLLLRGQGQTATEPITLPALFSVARFTHNGQSNFAVWVYAGSDKDLLINTIGDYSGTRPLVANAPIILDIDADGAWTVQIQPIAWGEGPGFSGRGDDVSPLFNPPGTGAWEFSHDGSSNFAVWLHCAGGTDLVQNEIGPVTGSSVVQFGRGPCCWEVIADGNWSLKAR